VKTVATKHGKINGSLKTRNNQTAQFKGNAPNVDPLAKYNTKYKRTIDPFIMERVKESASKAPPPPTGLHSVLVWLENNVRTKIEGTLIDKWVATPAKEYYKAAKRLD